MFLKIKYGLLNQPLVNLQQQEENKPVEILVPSDKSGVMRQGYLQTIDYAFRGVTNRVSGDIYALEVGNSWFGSVVKEGDNVKWQSSLMKDFIVIYDITFKSIDEKMYVAKKIDYDNTKRGNKGIRPIWQRELFEKDSKEIKSIYLAAIASYSQFLQDEKYDLVYVKGELKLKDKESKQGRYVDFDVVKDSDFYIFLKLINILVAKNRHMGVYFINCLGFSDNILKALINFIYELHGNTFVFLYNCYETSTVERDKWILPDYTKK